MTTTQNPLYADLQTLKEWVYDKCGFKMTNLKLKTESKEYGACSFELNGQKVEHRVSKITPTKTGQFVTIWKRNKDGITQPFDILDDIDFIVITSRSADNLGQFVFPKLVLEDKGIITSNGKEGKRGIRVYPPWDVATSKQAVKTQSWQTKYFLPIKPNNATDLDFARKLFSPSNKSW